MAGEDLGSWIWIVDLPDGSMNQVRLVTSNTLKDCPAFNPKSQLLIETQFHRLNPFPQASNMALKDPTFANWTLGKGGGRTDEKITHLRSTSTPSLFPPREGKRGKG